MAIREKILGPKHTHTAASMNNLALLYQSMGDYARAERLFNRALAIKEKAVGPEHPATAISLVSLARLYQGMGDYARAEPLYIRTVAIFEKALGPNHPHTAISLNNLGMFYYSLRDYARAEPLYKRALAINEKALGADNLEAALNLNNLAELYKSMGDYARAEPLCKRALAIYEKTLGPEHPHTAMSMSNLAALYTLMGDYTRAERMFKKALAIYEKTFGMEHERTANTLNNLATVYSNRGDYARSEQMYERTLAILERTLGPQHPRVAISLNNLALVKAARGDNIQAHILFIKAQKISAKVIEQIMGFTSEDQKLKFLSTEKWNFESALSLVASRLAKDKKRVREILDIWLGRKGAVLEAQRRFQEALVYSNKSEAARAFQEMAKIRADLSKLMFGGPGKEGAKAYREKLASLEAREKTLEAKVSRLSQAFARTKKVKRADTGQVARVLPRGSVLVDFAKIRLLDFKAKGQRTRWGPDRYLAFVLHAGQGNRVSLLDLGQASPIDGAVTELKEAMTELKIQKTMAVCEKLYKMVFAGLEEELGSARDIFISPDGNLNLIPFEVLRRPDGRYLIEEYSFNYLASGRDMVGYGMFRTRPGPPLILGDPDFDATEPGTTRAASFTRSTDMRGLYFDRLTGTRDEVEVYWFSVNWTNPIFV